MRLPKIERLKGDDRYEAALRSGADSRIGSNDDDEVAVVGLAAVLVALERLHEQVAESDRRADERHRELIRILTRRNPDSP